MKQLLAVTTLLLSLTLPAAAQVSTSFTQTPNPNSGLIGLHLSRPSTQQLPHGISFDLDSVPVWDIGIDFEYPDLVLAYSHTLQADVLRMRSDTAQTVLGPRVGHPVMPFQLCVAAGVDTAPLGGLAIGTYGWQYGIHLYNRTPGCKRTNINFFNLFSWGTDSPGNGTGDFWLHNYQTGTKVLTVSPDNRLGINASQLGFYGAATTARPTVIGSWSDGTAAKGVLAALVQLGLVADQTTP